MTSSLLQFVDHLDKAATGIKGAEQSAVKAATVAAQTTMTEAAIRVRTPKTINTARGKRGNAWRVRYLWYTSEAKPRSIVFYSGAPPYWREEGTKDHDVLPRKGKTLVQGGKGAGREGIYFASAHVKGVSARPFWLPAKVEIQRESEPIIRETTTASLIKAGYR